MKKLLFPATYVLLALPMVANAQLGNLEDLVLALRGIIDILIPLVGAIALLYFFWGLATFILATGDEEGRKKGKHIMIWGILALFIIVSVWGIVQWLGTALGVGTPQEVPIPGVGN